MGHVMRRRGTGTGRRANVQARMMYIARSAIAAITSMRISGWTYRFTFYLYG